MPITFTPDVPEYVFIATIAVVIVAKSRLSNLQAQIGDQPATAPIVTLMEIDEVDDDDNHSADGNSSPRTSYDPTDARSIPRPNPKTDTDIRKIIYGHLLIAGEEITSNKRIMGEDRNRMRYENIVYTPAFDVDSKILATCRAICYEAYPVLYGRNTFSFASAWEIVESKRDELSYNSVVPSFGLNYVRYDEGRFSLIRHIKLDMSKKDWSPVSLVSNWGKFLQGDSSFGTWVLRLPKLQSLYINFEGRRSSDQGECHFLKDFLARMKQFGPKNEHGTNAGIPQVTFEGEHDESTANNWKTLSKRAANFSYTVRAKAVPSQSKHCDVKEVVKHWLSRVRNLDGRYAIQQKSTPSRGSVGDLAYNRPIAESSI